MFFKENFESEKQIKKITLECLSKLVFRLCEFLNENI